MAEKRNISFMASAKLCNTCGACFGVCTVDAIHYEETTGGNYLPIVDESSCIRCGLCDEVCPGIHFSDTLKSTMPGDPFAGNVIGSYVGKAANKQIFDNSQSGGIVSALLVQAMETGQIKGAVTVVMSAGNPPRPVVQIARSNQEILLAQKSKYCPVPLLGFLKALNNDNAPVAVVGTSCQIHGLKKVLDKLPKLQGKIAFTIGLVCDRVLTYSALDYLVKKALISGAGDRINLHFRDKSVSGYPGDVHVFSDNGQSVVMPAKARMQIKEYFTSVACRLCFDKMNVFSDITVGDPYGLEGVDRKLGESMLVARTELGQGIVQAARTAQAIVVRPVEYDQVLRGQKVSRKKKEWAGYIEAWMELGFELPDPCGLIRKCAPHCSGERKYKKDLQYSLNLDNFTSHHELFHYVDWALRKKRLIRTALYPLRVTKRFFNKATSLMSKA